MHHHIEIDLTGAELAKLFREINDENVAFATIDGKNVRIKHFALPEPTNYEAPENFPDCCPYHTSVHNNSKEWFSRFPDCCSFHKEVKVKKWFNKKDFETLPLDIVRKLSYTETHISENLEHKDWYNLITEYFEFALESFGRPSIGNHVFNSSLKHYLIECKLEMPFPLQKRNLLIEFLEGYYIIRTEKTTDINILSDIIRKWAKSFPDLLFFREVKQFENASNSLKLINHTPSYNRYLQQATFLSRTRGDLIQYLITLTNNILLSIDSKVLLEKGVIVDPIKHKLDIINEKHRIKQIGLLTIYSKKEMRYIKVIKQWLKNEQEYFGDIAEHFTDLSQSKLSTAIDEINNNTKSISIQVNKLSGELQKYGELSTNFSEKQIEIYSQILANTEEASLEEFETDFKTLSLQSDLIERLDSIEESIINTNEKIEIRKELQNSDSLTAKGKLKLIIPLLLFRYEVEIEAAEKVKIPRTWKAFKRVFIKE